MNRESPESSGENKFGWMTEDDRKHLESISEELELNDYYGEWLDNIQSHYYEVFSLKKREKILNNARNFIEENKTSDVLEIQGKIMAYKGFIEKITSEGKL